MIRRINYTGRKRIKLDHVTVIVYKNVNGPAHFEAKIELGDYDLPKDASVLVEAYRQTSWMRFDFGRADALLCDQKRELTEFDSPDGILFRVKVTSQQPDRGKLLAEADQIPFNIAGEQKENQIPLLTVISQDLDHEIMKLDFTDRPILVINSSFGDWRTVARLPVFASLIYPQVFQQILTRILIIENYHEVDDVEDWRAQWLRYATLLPGVSTQPPPEGKDNDYDDWIETAVGGFCKSHNMLEKFRIYWEEGQSQ